MNGEGFLGGVGNPLSGQGFHKCSAPLPKFPVWLFISDFSLHSIGVMLFRLKQENAFRLFIEQTMDALQILSLPESAYVELSAIRARYGLDFDDACQFAMAREYHLKIMTMDKDFRAVADSVDVVFI